MSSPVVQVHVGLYYTLHRGSKDESFYEIKVKLFTRLAIHKILNVRGESESSGYSPLPNSMLYSRVCERDCGLAV